MVRIENYFRIKKYEIVDGLINTSGDVTLIKKVSQLPFKFNKVGGHFSGHFNCYNNQLTSLIGAPISVGGTFDCSNNQLTSLEGAPTSVGGCFYCDWSENLPLLRLLQYKKVLLYNNDQVSDIINKYCAQKPLKKAILDCQKELIENGFVGNAKW
jgi:hypothetical protein